jgi:hypothetical protein
MRLLTIVLLASTVLAAQEKGGERPRGQSGPPDESQSWTRGRLGTQRPMPGKLITLNGILLDASCEDRTAINLARPPEQQSADRSATPAKDGEPPPEVLAQQTPDAMARQYDRSCAITGGTKGYALLMTEGRLLNLDEGGNTLVLQGIHGLAEGRAMLNGTGPGIKPRVTLQGRVQGDRLIVEKIVKL